MKIYKDPSRGTGERRFFYHWFKQKQAWSVHFANACHVVNDIHCFVPCETKRRKTQPKAVMQGWAHEVKIKNGVAQII